MADRVLVAMSGGVDSSVAAARLVAQGHDVVGVTLHLWDYPDDGSVRGRCCAPEDIHDARRVADALGIPHYAFDRRELFSEKVVAPFVDAYLTGSTPSPCVECNRHVKLRELFGLADRLSARFVATGHYARIGRVGGRPRLRRARDPDKDQSYFLHAVPPGQLERLCFPLGESEKAGVRAEAVALDLPGAHKGESQELCFVPSGRYDTFVSARASGRTRPGPIVGADGRIVGNHDGIHRFTVGQRRNLGVALGRRAYVVGLDAENGVVRLGDEAGLASRVARLSNLVLSEGVDLPLECDAVVRYRGRPARARVTKDGNGVSLRFEKPLKAVVSGQASVFYDGDWVLGGASIVSAERDDPAVALQMEPSL